ncbi:MAG: sulfite exporter TauE/SafE family protein, partial [Nitrososphaeraceae archaeon]
FVLLKGSTTKRKNDNIKSFKVDGHGTSNRIVIHSKNRLILLESIIGFGVGFLGGLVGLVLGSILMPAMISILKMEPRVAVGTNLAAASVMGISGMIGHIINNNIDYLVLAVMGFAAMVGGYLGARYTNRFSDKSLKRIIGIVLIVVATTMFLRAFEIY